MQVGTPDYVAPEVMDCQAKMRQGDSATSAGGYGCSVDVWAVGVLAWELIGGKAPFSAKTIDQIKQNVVEGNTCRMPDCSGECKAFIQACMCRDARKRPSALSLLSHAWLERL